MVVQELNRMIAKMIALKIASAVFSAFAGNIGMKIATRTNVRTTQAAKTSLPKALKISFGLILRLA